MKRLRNTILLILLLLFILVLVLLGYRKFRQNQILNATKLNCESCIDTLLTFNFDKTEITALIRAENTDNTVLLFVHGGPGIPDMPFARIYDSLLVKDFICVHYDQRGTGKSYFNNDLDKTSIDDNVYDLIAVAEELKDLFPDNELFLVGQSWGTLISILAIQKEPELFDKYIGIGQIVNLKESDLNSFDFSLKMAKKLNDQESLELLSDLDRNDYNKKYESLVTQRRVLSKVGGRFYNINIKTSLTKIAFFSPEYILKELFQTSKSSKLLDRNLYKEMLTYDLFAIADSLPLPCCFISGVKDYQTPTPIVKKYYSALKSNEKKMIIFEKSGHIPNYEEPKRFYEELLKLK